MLLRAPALWSSSSHWSGTPSWAASLHCYGHNEALTKIGSLLQLTKRCADEVTQEGVTRAELSWQYKLKQCQDVA